MLEDLIGSCLFDVFIIENGESVQYAVYIRRRVNRADRILDTDERERAFCHFAVKARCDCTCLCVPEDTAAGKYIKAGRAAFSWRDTGTAVQMQMKRLYI